MLNIQVKLHSIEHKIGEKVYHLLSEGEFVASEVKEALLGFMKQIEDHEKSNESKPEGG